MKNKIVFLMLCLFFVTACNQDKQESFDELTETIETSNFNGQEMAKILPSTIDGLTASLPVNLDLIDVEFVVDGRLPEIMDFHQAQSRISKCRMFVDALETEGRGYGFSFCEQDGFEDWSIFPDGFRHIVRTIGANRHYMFGWLVQNSAGHYVVCAYRDYPQYGVLKGELIGTVKYDPYGSLLVRCDEGRAYARARFIPSPKLAGQMGNQDIVEFRFEHGLDPKANPCGALPPAAKDCDLYNIPDWSHFDCNDGLFKSYGSINDYDEGALEIFIDSWGNDVPSNRFKEVNAPYHGSGSKLVVKTCAEDSGNCIDEWSSYGNWIKKVNSDGTKQYGNHHFYLGRTPSGKAGLGLQQRTANNKVWEFVNSGGVVLTLELYSDDDFNFLRKRRYVRVKGWPYVGRTIRYIDNSFETMTIYKNGVQTTETVDVEFEFKQLVHHAFGATINFETGPKKRLYVQEEGCLLVIQGTGNVRMAGVSPNQRVVAALWADNHKGFFVLNSDGSIASWVASECGTLHTIKGANGKNYSANLRARNRVTLYP